MPPSMILRTCKMILPDGETHTSLRKTRGASTNMAVALSITETRLPRTSFILILTWESSTLMFGYFVAPSPGRPLSQRPASKLNKSSLTRLLLLCLKTWPQEPISPPVQEHPFSHLSLCVTLIARKGRQRYLFSP